MSIEYVKGNVLEPIGEGRKIIIHCCNNLFVMGAGVALGIKNKWPSVFAQYKVWGKGGKAKLGDIQTVRVEDNIAVCNMLGQDGVGFKDGIPPIRYDAIDACLAKVCRIAQKYNASVHAPRFGCGLAGGSWDKIEPLIIKNLVDNKVKVYVYDL